ncbi:putative Heterokaryon incompatibility domain-containing protein [Seiridium unicorne]|uniref:Heterokaryon incompatibility domain-containing protein n=1 Tax=Seiridium unicorne TaxID=138068 RepID=A0ABR2UQ24_9PEZI
MEIEYIWIDSLCIKQDDPDDWSAEASSMGSLYKNAYLVIFASGSTDSSGGLFISNRPTVPSFTLPFYNGENNGETLTSDQDVVPARVGNYHLRFAPPTNTNSPSDGPLARRAWALQEWHLARRRVSFMPGGLTWSCVGIDCDERGYPSDVGIYSDLSWNFFLQDYTKRELTYHTDRLKAIEGVAHEMERGGREGYSKGIWADDLISGVLWVPLELNKDKDNLADVPSWSWASTAGRKSWLLRDLEGEWCDITNSFSITDANTLRISGQLISVATMHTYRQRCCVTALNSSLQQVEWLQTEDESRIQFLCQMTMVQTYVGFGTPVGPRQLLLVSSTHKLLCGLALLDGIQHDEHNISCLLLAEVQLGEFEPDHHYQNFPVSHHDKADCLDFTCLNTATSYYFGIILEPVGGNSDGLKRIGVALLFSSTVEKDYQEVETHSFLRESLQVTLNDLEMHPEDWEGTRATADIHDRQKWSLSQRAQYFHSRRPHIIYVSTNPVRYIHVPCDLSRSSRNSTLTRAGLSQDAKSNTKTNDMTQCSVIHTNVSC